MIKFIKTQCIIMLVSLIFMCFATIGFALSIEYKNTLLEDGSFVLMMIGALMLMGVVIFFNNRKEKDNKKGK